MGKNAPDSTRRTRPRPRSGSPRSARSASWSPFAPEVLEDPNAHWAALHAHDPVPWTGDFDPPFYTLTRYADVLDALRDVDTFASRYGQGPRFQEGIALLSDPPLHTRFRKMLQKAFTPGRIRAFAPRIEEIAHELLDAIERRIASGNRSFELHDDLACPLPVIVIAEILGVPAGDRQAFKRWSDAAVEALGSENPRALAPELAELDAYLGRAIEAARNGTRRGDDLITALVDAANDAGDVSDLQLRAVVQQLLVGGNETTTSLITNAVWRLLEVPSRWQRLRDDPELVPHALEESLRFDPPVLGLYRSTTRPVTVRGVDIPERSKVFLSYAAANRDADVFDDPDIFDLGRSPDAVRPHLSFGHGIHFCIGAALARLEARTTLRVLLQRLPHLGPEGPGERIAPFFLWGRRALPLRVDVG